jgi:hypothetical protein
MSNTTTDLNPEDLLTTIDSAIDWVNTQQLFQQPQQSVQGQNTGTQIPTKISKQYFTFCSLV